MILDNQELIDGLYEDLGFLRGEALEGTAIALAIGGINLPANADRAVALRLGHFEGMEALALGAALRIGGSATFDFGLSHGLEYSQTGYSAGITLTW